MPGKIDSYLKWLGMAASEPIEVAIVEEKSSALTIRDADSDVLPESEKAPLTMAEYQRLKALALKSAKGFLTLYHSVPDKNATASPQRISFYGPVPRSAEEMYQHTKNVNAYYSSEIDVDADNSGDIYTCRQRGFEALEAKPDFLRNRVFSGSYAEEWTVRKVIRRFIWHDRIHAKAMYRMAVKTFGFRHIADPFFFSKLKTARRWFIHLRAVF